MGNVYLGAVYMGGGTGRLPGRDVFYPGFKNCLYGRRDGMFAGTGRFTRYNLQSQHNIVPAKRDGAFI